MCVKLKKKIDCKNIVSYQLYDFKGLFSYLNYVYSCYMFVLLIEYS